MCPVPKRLVLRKRQEIHPGSCELPSFTLWSLNPLFRLSSVTQKRLPGSPLDFSATLQEVCCLKSHRSSQELSTALEKQQKTPSSSDQPRGTIMRAVWAFAGVIGAKRSVSECPWLQLLPQVVSGLFDRGHCPRGFV